MASTDETEHLASSVAAATLDASALDSSPSPSGDQLEHINSLLRGLPSDLTPDQRERAETFIRSYANVFSTSEYDIGRTNIIPHRIARVIVALTSSSYGVTLLLSFRLSMNTFSTCWTMT